MAVWHRRAGKDEVCLHHTAIAASERVGNYWHCLPEYKQGRKAIWTSINAHTGKRRIDEAFPPEIRESTNDQEMFIRLLNGSTFQLIGSDRYDATVGAGVAGITYSEWALANPSAWGYHRPMLQENKGWACFITTPRGQRPHAPEPWVKATHVIVSLGLLGATLLVGRAPWARPRREDSAVEIAGTRVIAAKVEGADANSLRSAVDQLKSRLGSAVIVLAAVESPTKVLLVAGVTADRTAQIKAGELVGAIATQVGGKGGGRPDMAQAGGPDGSKAQAALDAVAAAIGGP